MRQRGRAARGDDATTAGIRRTTEARFVPKVVTPRFGSLFSVCRPVSGQAAFRTRIAGLALICLLAPADAAAACSVAQIVAVQRTLAEAGYEPGPIDGLLGPLTRGAIRRWQRAGRIPPNGRLACEDAPAKTAKTKPAPDMKAARPVIAFSGGTYSGALRNGRPNGRGKFVAPDGRRYVGQWKDGKRHGRGVLVSKSVGRYSGDFDWGDFHGQGMLLRPDGAVYTGAFLVGRFHGPGRLRLPDGRVYDGPFVNGRPHGAGTLFLDNRRVDGRWRHGCAANRASRLDVLCDR